MSELVDFMAEREKRILGAVMDSARIEDQAVICGCGSARFWLVLDGSAECAKCKEKQPNIRWILNNG